MKILSKNKVKWIALNHKNNAAAILRREYLSTFDFLDKSFTSNQKFSEKMYKYVYGENNVCVWCKKKPTTFRSFNEGYLDFCSQPCQQFHTASKYGVNNLFQSPEIKKKIKVTCIKKYGVTSPMKSSEVIRLGKQKKKERYGDENYNNLEKSRKTCMDKYGVRSATQLPEIHEKVGYKWKTYTTPSGRKIRCQGYEPFALNVIYSEYPESDIVVSKKFMPEVWYVLDGTRRRYFPDIYIKSKDMIVEVKSRYTFDSKIVESMEKHNESKRNGHGHEIWIFDKRGVLEEKIL